MMGEKLGKKWEIRFHGRGGQGAVTASKILAEAAYLSGFEAQSIPFFGAERRGAPVMAFTRVSYEAIHERSQVYTPDYVIVLDPIILDAVDVFRGLKDGGSIVINTVKSPMDFQFEQGSLLVATVDATGIAIKNNLLVAGTPVVNMPMLGAFLKIFSHIELETLEEVVMKKFGKNGKANVAAVREAYESTVVEKVRGSGKPSTEDVRRKRAVTMPVSTPSPGVAGRTRFWRDFRPEVDYDVCSNCLSCWLHCPESAIQRVGSRIEIDYEFCKGCLVCSAVCPKKAIRVSREVVV
jgi:2-oxoacid:acceptor oxidoreductase gamma subunit (pyruvate/2-ketoisovalerate family)/2-oxoacid:acceptor oxidoreductase delta subunit (pyruvate/2-ketoisovalerate family)